MSAARSILRERIEREAPVFAPLCLDPLTARLCEDLGFGAGYLSGGGLGFSLAVSEALLTLSELASVAGSITKRCDLPLIVDIGVGFGDPVHVSRAVWEMEAAGAAALEIEDQIAPKRVSHHRGIEHLVPTEEMVSKIEAATDARRDPDLLIIARTGGVRNEGFDSAIRRGKAYADAGADMIMLFPATDENWVSAPGLLGSPVAVIEPLHLRSRSEWSSLGYSLVIDAYTGQVLAYETVKRAYTQQAAGGRDGRPRDELMKLYRELPAAAGLIPLYDIESATTERGSEPSH